MPIDYSRFDGIDTSDSEDERAVERQAATAEFAAHTEAAATAQPAPQPPDNVMEDLEDYFERLDARRGPSEAGAPEAADAATAASVERFSEEDFERLERVRGPGLRADGLECPICLAAVDAQEECVQLPCAARHRFHVDCGRSWLTRNVSCPMCRVDVRHLIRIAASPAVPLASEPSQAPPPAADAEDAGQMSPRSFGFTRDGGIIARYEPRPPPELPRPPYIPEHLHEVAELVEIDYPDRGTARVWRVPR